MTRRTPLAVAALALSAAAVRDGRAGPVDAAVGRALRSLRTPARDAFVRVATDLGSLHGVGVVTGTLLAAGAHARAGRVARAGLLAWTVAQAAKRTLPRGRPYEVDGVERLVIEPAGSSWPSGHAAVAAAMADVLAEGQGRLVRRTLGKLALGVALSRVYVGVHHPTDVVAGAGIGVLCGRLLRAR